jgi:tRNA threonylcarbamoyladenosine biosynthesis protein TsaE
VDPTTVDLPTLDDTRELARRLLQRAPGGSLLVLSGPLGAGKTTLTRFLAEALGSDADVTSPSYTLVHEYPTPQGVLVHIDAYRLPDAAALEQLGLDETLDRARLVVVEWGTGLLAHHPDALWLDLERHGEARRATLRDASGHPLGWDP